MMRNRNSASGPRRCFLIPASAELIAEDDVDAFDVATPGSLFSLRLRYSLLLLPW
jgi:hypothetical protein